MAEPVINGMMAALPLGSSAGSAPVSTPLPLTPDTPHDVLYQARSLKQKEKCLRFFGDNRIPLQVGSGSASKLRAFFGDRGVRGSVSSSSTLAPSTPSRSTELCPSGDDERDGADAARPHAAGDGAADESDDGDDASIPGGSGASTPYAPYAVIPTRAAHIDADEADTDAEAIAAADAEDETRNPSNASSAFASEAALHGSDHAAEAAVASDRDGLEATMSREVPNAPVGRMLSSMVTPSPRGPRCASSSLLSLSSSAPTTPMRDGGGLRAMSQSGALHLGLGSGPPSRRWSAIGPHAAESLPTLLSKALNMGAPSPTSTTPTDDRTSASVYVDAQARPTASTMLATATTSPLRSRATRGGGGGGGADMTGVARTGWGITFAPLTVASTRKLHALLGENCPLDVPVRDVEQQGLRVLLQSKLPQLYFCTYLLRSYHIELLFFVGDVQLFEQQVFENDEDLRAAATAIFDDYLTRDGAFEVNFSCRGRRAVVDAMKQGSNRRCFMPVMDEAAAMLDRAFMDFKDSPLFAAMKQDLGHAQVHSRDALARVEKQLLDVLRSQYRTTTSGAGLDGRSSSMPGSHASIYPGGQSTGGLGSTASGLASHGSAASHLSDPTAADSLGEQNRAIRAKLPVFIARRTGLQLDLPVA